MPEQPVPLPDQTVLVDGTRHGGAQCFGEPGGQKIAFCAREEFAAQLRELLPPLLPECQGFSCPGQGKGCVKRGQKIIAHNPRQPRFPAGEPARALEKEPVLNGKLHDTKHIPEGFLHAGRRRIRCRGSGEEIPLGNTPLFQHGSREKRENVAQPLVCLGALRRFQVRIAEYIFSAAVAAMDDEF